MTFELCIGLLPLPTAGVNVGVGWAVNEYLRPTYLPKLIVFSSYPFQRWRLCISLIGSTY